MYCCQCINKREENKKQRIRGALINNYTQSKFICATQDKTFNLNHKLFHIPEMCNAYLEMWMSIYHIVDESGTLTIRVGAFSLSCSSLHVKNSEVNLMRIQLCKPNLTALYSFAQNV